MNTASRLRAIQNLCASLNTPLPGDTHAIRYSDGAVGTASATLLRTLSKVWAQHLENTNFKSTEEIKVEMSMKQFALLKVAWMQIVQGQTPEEWMRIPVPEAIELLIHIDRLAMCESLAESLALGVQDRMRAKECLDICADPSIDAVPPCVLKLLMPTLLEFGPECVTNTFIRKEVADAQAYVDSKGLVWQEREKSMEQRTDLFLSLKRRGMAPNSEEEFEVLSVMPFDDQHLVFHYVRRMARDNAFLACVNVATQQVAGAPRLIGDSRRSVAMNGLCLFLSVRTCVHVYDRAFVRGEQPPLQIINTGAESFRVWALDPSLMVVENVDTFTLTVYTPRRPDNEYESAYRIQLDHILLGGLCLSDTRLLVHCGPLRQSALQLYEKDTPIGTPHPMGCLEMGHNIAWNAHRVCHRFGRIYALENHEATHVVRMLDPATLAPLGLVEGFQSREPCRLIGYGTRLLVTQSPLSDGVRIDMLDLFANQKRHGTLVHRCPFNYWTVAVGAMVVAVNSYGRVMVLSRAE